jgi:hypothetical protein
MRSSLPYRFAPPPSPFRRRTVRLGNVALVSASLLPYKKEWQAIANREPHGSTLIVLPHAGGPQRLTCERVAADLTARGRPVRVVSADQVLAS